MGIQSKPIPSAIIMKIKVNGSILWLKCECCAHEFPTFRFSGENDVTTGDFRTLTDLLSGKLYVLCRFQLPTSGTEVQFSRVEKERAIPTESFQEYQIRHKKRPPQYFYHCLECGSENARVSEAITEEELNTRGYSFVNKVS